VLAPASRDDEVVVAARFGHQPVDVPKARFAQDLGELRAQVGPVADLVVVCLPGVAGFVDEEQVDRVGARIQPIPRLEVDPLSGVSNSLGMVKLRRSRSTRS